MSENVFHDHLDHCTQCREQPFNLCLIGQLAAKRQLEVGSSELPDFTGTFSKEPVRPITDEERTLFRSTIQHQVEAPRTPVNDIDEVDTLIDMFRTTSGPVGDFIRRMQF